MYLEGLDQYRGWFQSSLLTAVGALGKGAPFKECVTHGWTVDGEGKAMHKSLGNGVDPADVFNEVRRGHPAPVGRPARTTTRTCAAPTEIFKQLSQNYLKFRNTCKFMPRQPCRLRPRKADQARGYARSSTAGAVTKLNELIEKCRAVLLRL